MRTNWPAPLSPASKASDAIMLKLWGDLHHGGVAEGRTDKVLTDVLTGNVPTPNYHIAVGDLVDAVQIDANDLGHPNWDVRALKWLNSLNAPWYAALGNHDILTGTSSRDAPAAAAAFGLPAMNYTVDLGTVVLVFISPTTEQANNTTCVYDATTLAWLTTTLAGISKDVILIVHAPLYNTVLGDSSTYNTSTATGFWAAGAYLDADSSALTTIIAANANVKGYICGHTHSPLLATALTTTVTLGGRQVAHINCSALYYQKKSVYWNDPLISPYLLYSPSANTFEVRWRDHGKGIWTGPNGVKVTTLTAT